MFNYGIKILDSDILCYKVIGIKGARKNYCNKNKSTHEEYHINANRTTYLFFYLFNILDFYVIVLVYFKENKNNNI